MLNLSTWLGIETITKAKGELALQYLETENQNINLIIVRSKIAKEQTAKLIIEYMRIKGLDIPLIVIGPGDFPNLPHIANSLDIKILIKAAATALEITAKDMGSKVVPDFFSIPIHYFQTIKRSVCSVYAQQVDDSKKYNLLTEKNIDFAADLITNLMKQKIKHLYIDKMDRLEFVSNVTSELISHLETEDLSDDELISAVDKSVELFSRKLMAIGITEETVNLAKKNIASISATAKKSTKLFKLLDRLLNNKTSYMYKHTQILTYISLHLIQHIDWGNAEQEEKISFIAFFHDIVLENDLQCQISSNHELKKSSLPALEKTLVEKHAQLAAEFVAKFPHAPMGSDQIIRQHHGQLHGLGFSDQYGSNMSPMAMVFIVAEDCTRIIMKQESGPLNRELMLKEMREKFTTNRFLKIVDKLESLAL